MKNFLNITILLTSVLFFSQIAVASFPDVYPSHPYLQAIDYVKSQGIVDGYPDGTYKPDSNINRAEFTKIIVGALLDYTPDRDNSDFDIYSLTGLKFKDLEDKAWYVPFLRHALKANLISGNPDGTFRPESYINFAEASKILVKGYNFEHYEDSEVWYRSYVQILEGQKAIPVSIKGFEHKVTRGEMAEMIHRLTENITDKSSLTYENIESGCNSTCSL